MKVLWLLFWSLVLGSAGFSIAQSCEEFDNESVLHPGIVYTYKFQVEANASVPKISGEEAKSVIVCEVVISHAHTCFYSLQLQQCSNTVDEYFSVKGTSGTEYHSLPELSRYSLLFSIASGEIKELYTHPEDPIHAVNVKRAVLSAFVFKLSQVRSSLKEVHADIHGTCSILSIPDESEGLISVEKDMLSCVYPRQTFWKYSLFPQLQSQAKVNSTSKCYYEINEKRIEKVACVEKHSFLESTHNATDTMEAQFHYQLNFKGSKIQSEIPDHPLLTRKTDIIYENEGTADCNSGNHNLAAKEILIDIVHDSLDEIDPSVVLRYRTFVGHVRASKDLLPLIQEADTCFHPRYMKCMDSEKELLVSFLTAALMNCESLPCVKGLSHLMKSYDLSSARKSFIYFALSQKEIRKSEHLIEYVRICQVQDSNMCWMAVGNMARQIYERNKTLGNEVLQELGNTVDILLPAIRKTKGTSGQDANKNRNILMAFKVIKNMGELFTFLGPKGVSKVIDIVLEYETPIAAKVSGLEVLKETNAFKNEECRAIFHEKILPVLNSSSDTSLKILIYDHLIRFQEQRFVDSVVKVLTLDGDDDFKFYVAGSLENLLSDIHAENLENRFAKYVKSYLDHKNISLRSLVQKLRPKSWNYAARYLENISLNISREILRELKIFNLECKDLLHLLRGPLITDVCLHLLKDVLPLLNSGGYVQALQELAIIFQKILPGLRNIKEFVTEQIFKSIIGYFTGRDRQDFPTGKIKYNFDEKIIAAIKELENIFKESNSKVKVFQTLMDFFDDFMLIISRYISSRKIFFNDLHLGLTLHPAIVVQLQENFHHIPTIAGLPLTWTQTSTLAYKLPLRINFASCRSSSHSLSGTFSPSMAASSLSRMDIIYGNLTRVGVQVSLYGSAAVSLKYNLDIKPPNIHLKFNKAEKFGKILQFYKNYDLIRNNGLMDITHGDAITATTTWCTPHFFNFGFGQELCVNSYPSIFDGEVSLTNMKKLEVTIRPMDQREKNYYLNIQNTTKSTVLPSFVSIFRHSDAGVHSEISMDALLLVVLSLNKTIVHLTIPQLPDFEALFSKDRRTMQDGTFAGYFVRASLMLYPGYGYVIDYDKDDRVLFSRNDAIFAWKRFYSLQTPYNSYKLVVDNQILMPETFSISMFYKNFVPSAKWSTLFPESFWDDDGYAWMKLLFRGEHSQKNKHFTFLNNIDLLLPHSIISFEVPLSSDNHLIAKLTANDSHTGKEIAYAVLSYSRRSAVLEDSNRIVNRVVAISVPPGILTLMLDTIQVESQMSCILQFNIAPKIQHPRLLENDREIEDYAKLGLRMKATFEFDTEILKGDELTRKYETVTSDNVDGLAHRLIAARMFVNYPVTSVEDLFFVQGFFIFSSGPEEFRFQNNIHLDTRNFFEMNSQLVYRTSPDSTNFFHEINLPDMNFDKPPLNLMEFRKVLNSDKCLVMDFKHTVESSVFHLLSNATYRCNSLDSDLHTLLLNISTYSPYWDSLNTRLKQIIQDVSSEYSNEVMVFIHPLLKVKVVAEWFDNKRHTKKARFCNNEKMCTDLEIEMIGSGQTQVTLSLPDERQTRLAYEKLISPDFLNFSLKFKHSDEDGSRDVLDISRQMVSNRSVWKVKFDSNGYEKVRSIIVTAAEEAANTFLKISKDPNHPLNIILKPSLSTTLFGFWRYLRRQANLYFKKLMNNVEKISSSVLPIYGPVLGFSQNAALEIKKYSKIMYYTLKKSLFGEGVLGNLASRSSAYLKSLNFPWNIPKFPQFTEDNVMQFEFSIDKTFTVDYFKQLPRFSVEQLYSSILETKLLNSESSSSLETKTAMMFGPLHIHTFDGYVYDIPEFIRQDCKFLLSHDAHKSSFTVLADFNGIYILFPEISITINSENDIFVNGSLIQNLPFESSNKRVVLTKPEAVEVRSDSLNVICSTELTCIFELTASPRSTFGLLGNGDGRLNEFRLPEGNVASSIQELVTRYEVSGKPGCDDIKSETMPLSLEERANLCSKHYARLALYLKDTAKSFFNFCILDKSTTNFDSGSCSDLSLQKQSECAGSTDEAKIARFTSLHTLEVVLIVQEHKNFLHKNLETSDPLRGIKAIIRTLDEKFKSNGFSSSLYTLIGFGGKGGRYQPSVRSTRSNEWLPVDVMVDEVLPTLQFTGTEEADAFEAIRYATDISTQSFFEPRIYVIIMDSDKTVIAKTYQFKSESSLEMFCKTIICFTEFS